MTKPVERKGYDPWTAQIGDLVEDFFHAVEMFEATNGDGWNEKAKGLFIVIVSRLAKHVVQ